jgi:CheY-like chemotaxis protein
MVIEDDAVMRELIADWLTAAGYRVSTAGNCLAGLAQAARSRPSLFVTDMRMPGPSGAAAISMLKQQHPEIGVIAISGYFHGATGSSAEGALAAGAARALAKPVRRADFLRVVAELIGTPP